MGIFINGVDITKSPFSIDKTYALQLTDIFRALDKPVDTGSNRASLTDADFKVWSITGGLPVVPGRDCLNRCESSDENG